MNPLADITAPVWEWPLATREECWRAYRPGQPFSESSFQRLRRKGLLSDGIRVSPRRDGQAMGQGRYFSRLNLLALEAHRTGDLAEWERLVGLAAGVEVDQRVTGLAQSMIHGHGHVIPPPSSRLSGTLGALVEAVCELTDRWQRVLPGPPTRMAAVVATLTGGVADLAFVHGGRCSYSEAKLATIGRAGVGEAVYLYIVDMGGPDELVRARPGVRFTAHPDHTSTANNGPPGPFERQSLTVTGPAADSLAALVASAGPVPLPDLSGLRWTSDR